MNKLLIVLLAVCLVSAHDFVKRDVPAAGNTAPSQGLDGLLKQSQDLWAEVQKKIKEQAGNLKEFGEKALKDIQKQLSSDKKEAATGT